MTISVTTLFQKLTTGNNVLLFNVSALLLDDALLECVVTEVGLFSIVAFKTLDISQGSVATQLWCGGIFIANLLLILTVK